MSTLMDNPGGGTSVQANPNRGPASGTTLMGPTAGGTTLVGSLGTALADSAAPDPIVGWLVVIFGPGRGRAVNLGMGMNIIGRGHRNRVILDFGDAEISDDDHFRVAYDREGRDFRLIPARGTNLLYASANKDIPKAAVYDAQVLSNGTEIRLGQTILRFVALCGHDWDWSDGVVSADTRA